jgi:hypothetical protein
MLQFGMMHGLQSTQSPEEQNPPEPQGPPSTGTQPDPSLQAKHAPSQGGAPGWQAPAPQVANPLQIRPSSQLSPSVDRVQPRISMATEDGHAPPRHE